MPIYTRDHVDLIQLHWLMAQVQFDVVPYPSVRRAYLAMGNYRLAAVEDGFDEVVEVDADPPWDWINPPPSRRS